MSYRLIDNETNEDIIDKLGRIKDERDKYKEVLDKIKEMTKDLFETEYEGTFKRTNDNCCERFYLLEELNKLLEEIE